MLWIPTLSLVWICFSMEVQAADPKVSIVQTYPATTTYNGRTTIVMQKDKDCLMACKVSNKPSYRKPKWIFQNLRTNTTIPISTDTNTQNSFKYLIDKPASNLWRLKIRNMQPSDEGVYICRIQLFGFNAVDGKRYIKIVETPRISDLMTSSHMEVNEGEKAELRCSADGIPPPVISWKLVSGGPLPTGGREFNGPVILLDQVTRDNNGLYKCVAQNEAGRDERNIRLNVKYQPTINSRSEEIYQAVGYSRQLTCEAYGRPLPEVSQILWFKDGDILENQNKYTYEAFIGSTSVLMKLTVHAIDDGDFGRYRCYAENSEGIGEHFVDLKRSDTPVREFFRPRSGSSHTLVQTYLIVLLSLFSICL